ncbi:MAG TPA: NADH-ubiquinone oxidoreductase-F iron-sulfur binding region domain-containing protein [Candidatus Limnocylindrales bacterium]
MTFEARLLAGPAFAAGMEPYAAHRARLGQLPPPRPELIDTIVASGLLGRGGAGFPVGRKWQAVESRSLDDARILVNGAEAEPLSAKDRALMHSRPHLVLDGALLAAGVLGAREIVLYVGARHVDAQRSLQRAIAERGRLRVPVRIVLAPDAYVAGEESAAVHFVNASDARPTVTPPRPFESGIDGYPTLVQNVESLANVALIARGGDAWYRSLGRGETRGTALVTVSGAPHGGVREIELGMRVGEIAAVSGVAPESVHAVLLGGYFGRWLTREQAWPVPLDPLALRAAGATFGAGVISFLPAHQCGVAATATVLEYMAAQSAAQCGPCVFGLRAIADTTFALATNSAGVHDLERLERWTGQITGRGACRHPDGAVAQLASAMAAFSRDFASHARGRGCEVAPALRQAA